ncbi:protein FAR1-RELATED SEQUENCE 5-like [Rosa chinensis]|uniref:protein FAR1-RELATED SEQUENCE 5-like n=1 Tax=Rosa chinensis TaxID=74649 RepID=UPI000D093BEF|nr:protein FAR1-RELATED SEQUENCE 5-like [Rosa chinensis]
MVNIPTHQQFDILGVQAGGFQYIGCTQQDLYNLERDKRKETRGHDGEMLHDYFLLEQEKDSGFYFTIKADIENKITHCFWADTSSRQLYKCYVDVIIFDTTYQTNRYSLIFAPLMGINNHGQTIVFGAAFLSDETADSFMWLLKEFLNAMPGGAPKMIITDQDPAMEKAIFEVLPDTFHRYCSWHILRKFSEKLDAIKYRDHYDDFKNCIYSYENGEEFDFKWRSVLAKSGLSGHNWLQSIYEFRFRWVPPYMNHVFSSGMSSSQRAESGHSFFKEYVSDQNSLVDFMVQFNWGLLHKRHEELISDHIDINEKPRFKCPIKMEKQMADIYTRKYYYMFQDQLWESYNYNLEVTTEGETNCILKVMREDHEDGRARVIMYDKSKDFASCSCKLFESAGVPCRHVLAFLHKVRQLHKLPDQYILKRWTKSARSEVVMDKSDMEQYSHVIDSVVLSEEASQLFSETMDSLIEKIRPLLANCSSEGVEPCVKRSSTHQTTFREPDEVKTKGRAKRIKRGKEKANGKRNSTGRHCHGCGKDGQTHDKCNCPVLLNQFAENFGGDDIDDDSYSSQLVLLDIGLLAAIRGLFPAALLLCCFMFQLVLLDIGLLAAIRGLFPAACAN